MHERYMDLIGRAWFGQAEHLRFAAISVDSATPVQSAMFAECTEVVRMERY